MHMYTPVHRTVFHVQLTSGACSIGELSYDPHSLPEVLIPPGASFKVLEVKAKDGLTVVYCRQIETGSPLLDSPAVATLHRSSRFPHDARAWRDPLHRLHRQPGVWLHDWSQFDRKMGELDSLLRRLLTPLQELVARPSASHSAVTDIFISHSGGMHEDGAADNHERVSRVNDALRARRWRTWFDMRGDVRAATEGMERSHLVLICLTRR